MVSGLKMMDHIQIKHYPKQHQILYFVEDADQWDMLSRHCEYNGIRIYRLLTSSRGYGFMVYPKDLDWFLLSFDVIQMD